MKNWRIGTQKKLLSDFASPHKTDLIHLPLLSVGSVRSMAEDFQVFSKIGEPGVECIRNLSGGVPRAVFLALQTLMFIDVTLTEETLISEKMIIATTVSVMQRDLTRETKYDHTDCKFLDRCLEIAFTGMALSVNSYILNECATTVIARYGLYRDVTDAPVDHFYLVAPPYMLMFFNEYGGKNIRSIVSITSTEEKGSRLEKSFWRTLQIRWISIKKNSFAGSWSLLGLSFLQDIICPFPEHGAAIESFIFPKITSIARPGTSDEIAQFLHREGTVPDKVEFPPEDMPALFEQMKIGHYYIPLPKSGCADSMIRCGENEVVCFQFKNLRTKINKKTATREARKSKAIGWKVYLVIVCTAGHIVNSGANTSIDIDGVTVVMLSLKAVEIFLGLGTLNAITSSSAYADQARRNTS